jgi:hypothetical protein
MYISTTKLDFLKSGNKHSCYSCPPTSFKNQRLNLPLHKNPKKITSSPWLLTLHGINPLNAELNPICHLLALLGGATIVVVSRLRVKDMYSKSGSQYSIIKLLAKFTILKLCTIQSFPLITSLSTATTRGCPRTCRLMIWYSFHTQEHNYKNGISKGIHDFPFVCHKLPSCKTNQQALLPTHTRNIIRTTTKHDVNTHQYDKE